MLLSPQILPQHGLRLYAKKLLYSIDLNISVQEKSDSIVFSAEGPARFGPFSQSVYIESIYQKGEMLKFKSHRFDLKDRLSFSYKLKDKELHLQSSKKEGIEIFSVIEEPWWDPLSLLLQIRYDFFNKNLQPNYHSVTNQKFSNIVRKEDEKGTFFERKGKKQFYLLPSKESSLVIDWPSFKVQLCLSKA